MSAGQFQTFIVAWAATITTLVVLVGGVIVAIIKQWQRVQEMLGHTQVRVAQQEIKVEQHDKALNGGLDTQIKRTVEVYTEAKHARRATDPPPPPPGPGLGGGVHAE